jgi:hypothetical protein
MTTTSFKEIEHCIKLSQSFTFNKKKVYVFDNESRKNIINGIDKLIFRVFCSNLEEIPICKKEKKEIQELLLLKEFLKDSV